MHYSLSWSGGKDSTASIILAHEHGEPIDSILFSEVMFDKQNGISGENPRHIEFVKNKAKPLFESWGYKVYILHAQKDFLDVFNRIIEKPTKRMEHKGKKYGFCVNGLCSVKRDCKLKPLYDFYKEIDDEITQYVGIGIDEPQRLESLRKQSGAISLLEKYGYTEQMAKELCVQYDLLSPSYELTKRNGCWFCPNAKLVEHKEIRKLMPGVWRRFIELENEDNVANYLWNPYTKETLHEREEVLLWDERQMTIFDFI